MTADAFRNYSSKDQAITDAMVHELEYEKLGCDLRKYSIIDNPKYYFEVGE